MMTERSATFSRSNIFSNTGEKAPFSVALFLANSLQRKDESNPARTGDLRLRRPLLYPAELWTQIGLAGFEPAKSCSQSKRRRPLDHNPYMVAIIMNMEDHCQPNPQTAQIVELLLARYPDTTSFLIYRTPFELLIAVILSAQCTDAKVNEVTPGLFRAYPTPAALASAPLPSLEKLLYSTGFYKAKAGYIKETSRILCDLYHGEVPMGMSELTALPGVGRKTANVMRGHLAGLPAVIVDTHFKRVVRRLGLTDEHEPEKIERAIQDLIADDKQFRFSMAANRHGRELCTARSPQCPECPVARQCPSRS